MPPEIVLDHLLTNNDVAKQDLFPPINPLRYAATDTDQQGKLYSIVARTEVGGRACCTSFAHAREKGENYVVMANPTRGIGILVPGSPPILITILIPVFIEKRGYRIEFQP
jgi:hypothetical protein